MSDATPSQYFYMAGGERRGPFSFEQLLQQPIHRQTPVWGRGMSDWQPAQDVPGLADLIPPPPPQGTAGRGHPAGQLSLGNDMDRFAGGLYRLNFGIPVLILATFVLAYLTGNAFGIAYGIVAVAWAVLLWDAAVIVKAEWPWLWALAGVLPVVSYVPLIILHGWLKRPLVAAGYRVGFFGRATPPARVDA